MTAVAWTLVHFIWQGALVALVAGLILRSTRVASSTRYLVGVVALGAMFASPVSTFLVIRSRAAVMTVPPHGGASAAQSPLNLAVDRTTTTQSAQPPAQPKSAATSLAPFVVVPWVFGVVVLSVRLFGGWMVARRFARRLLQPVAPEIAAMVRSLSSRLAIDRVVQVFESSGVSVPVVIGWVRPVVLVPAAALAGLSPAHVEALLAHELAHVRRHDYLVNLLQTAVETLLFYHPAVWWVSRQVRTAREQCCDDLAVSVCDRLEYVTALSTLAAMTARPRLALAATDGSLVSRVRRLLGQPAADRGAASVWLSGIVAVGIVGLIPVVLARVPVQDRAATATGSQAGTNEGSRVEVVPERMQPARPEIAREVSPDVLRVPRGEMAQTPRPDVRELERMLVESQASARGGTPAELAEAERLAQLVQLRNKLVASEAQLAQIRRQRSALEIERVEQAAKSEAAEVADRLLRLRNLVAARKTRVELGVESSVDLSELQAELAATERQKDKIENERRVKRDELRLEEQLSEQVRAHEQLSQDYGRLLSAREARLIDQRIDDNRELSIRQARELDVLAQRDRAATMAPVTDPAATTRVGDRLSVMLQGEPDLPKDYVVRADGTIRVLAQRDRAVPTEVVTDPAVTIRAGDRLDVTLQGEPDLPKDYVVRADGTIRLPLLGSFKVQGLTTAQIRDVVTRQAARFIPKAAVEVVLRRRR
jgi:beta-lactamase regulating signal transducer with metallopeptidase domain